MKKHNVESILNLQNIHGIGSSRIRSLAAHFSIDEEIFLRTVTDLCIADGIDLKTARAIRACVNGNYGKKELQLASKQAIRIISFWDSEYPALLKKIYDPPIILYLRGRTLNDQDDYISVIGTRNPSEYGKAITKLFVNGLHGYGFNIVSGFARGIDTLAHINTLKLNGKTVAILGCGVDIIYPPENNKLMSKLIEKGTVISEFPLGAKPDAVNFPRRNRIISGFSHATIVIETGNKSGAILTALNAIDQGREVFAVPGRITDKQSIGCNRLIRNGAISIENVDLVVQHLQPRLRVIQKNQQQTIPLHLSDAEQKILKRLSNDPIHIDMLTVSCEVELTELLNLLLSLELKGAIRQISGKQFVLA